MTRAFRIIVPGIVIFLVGVIVGFFNPEVSSLIVLLGVFVAAVGLLVLVIVGFVTLATAGEKQQPPAR